MLYESIFKEHVLLCAAVDPHRAQHLETPMTSTAIASLGNFVPSLLQASMHDLAAMGPRCDTPWS